jgi:hypothetical protein
MICGSTAGCLYACMGSLHAAFSAAEFSGKFAPELLLVIAALSTLLMQPGCCVLPLHARSGWRCCASTAAESCTRTAFACCSAVTLLIMHPLLCSVPAGEWWVEVLRFYSSKELHQNCLQSLQRCPLC